MRIQLRQRVLISLALAATTLGAHAEPGKAPPTAAQVAAYADQLLGDTHAADGPGAAVLVARGDEVLYRGARGMASIELGVPLSPDQVFRIGSVTQAVRAQLASRRATNGSFARSRVQ